MLRQLLHKHYLPPLRGKLQEPLVSANVAFAYSGQGVFLDKASESTVLPLVQPLIKTGAEVFIIDAGWYNGAPLACSHSPDCWEDWLGDWRYSKEKYPRGFGPISAPLAASQVAFGLWFTPELLSPHAPLLRDHPEWVRQRSGEKYFNINLGGTLRMEMPEAREWFLNQVEELINKQGMNCYRQDGYLPYDDLHDHESDDRRGIQEIKYILGLYSMEDTLRQRHPDLIMEAATGAPRIDLETLSRFHWHQPCETWLDSNLDQGTLYGTNLWLPGGVIVLYTEALSNYGMWSSFAGQLCLAFHPLDAGIQMDLAREQVERYKRIRPFLSGDFYPLTPLSANETWLGYQFHRVDLDEGFVLVFKRFNSPHVIHSVQDPFQLQLRGVNPQFRYRIHFESSNKEGVYTGRELNKGISVTIGEAPGAEMVVYNPIW
jgi:alpha-galactosidase